MRPAFRPFSQGIRSPELVSHRSKRVGTATKADCGKLKQGNRCFSSVTCARSFYPGKQQRKASRYKLRRRKFINDATASLIPRRRFLVRGVLNYVNARGCFATKTQQRRVVWKTHIPVRSWNERTGRHLMAHGDFYTTMTDGLNNLRISPGGP